MTPEIEQARGEYAPASEVGAPGSLLDLFLAETNAGGGWKKAPDGSLVATGGEDDVSEKRASRSVLRAKAEEALQRFLKEPSPGKAIDLWLNNFSRASSLRSVADLVHQFSRDIAAIDRLINGLVNEVIHHPQFQQIEASWRGLKYLVQSTDDNESIKIRVLSAGWKELSRDFDRASEFDQSQMFKKIYEEGIGTPGAEPFSVLLGDYQLRHKPMADYGNDDLAALRAMSEVAAAAFAPFISSAHPSLFGLDSFTDLDRPTDFGAIFQRPEYLKWRALRQSPDARFVGLILPRILMRRPHEDFTARSHGFRFHEELDGEAENYLWGNPIYAFGAVLTRAFSTSAWLSDIRGVRRGEEGGGLVNLPSVDFFRTDTPGVINKPSIETIITDAMEKELSDLGFIPLCHCADTEFGAFYAGQSMQQPAKYNNKTATANARLSAMLQYILCVSRFAHYVKVIMRDKVGTFEDADAIQAHLNNWLTAYVADHDQTDPDVRAKFPLRKAEVQVRQTHPGVFGCTIFLQPHSQLDELTASVKLETNLVLTK